MLLVCERILTRLNFFHQGPSMSSLYSYCWAQKMFSGFFVFLFFKFDWLIDWLPALLGPRFRARALFSCGKWGPLFIAVRGPLTIAASPVVEHRLQMHRLSNCGSRAQLLHGMRDPPRPGLEPTSPALAGRLPTTAPPGKPCSTVFADGIGTL